jgi:AmmeMemoRadiSam system protein A
VRHIGEEYVGPSGRLELLRLARQALEARVCRREAPPVVRGGDLDQHLGAFVTIFCRGELRGCLGRVEADVPLAEVVCHLAAVVSESDPRFAPVSPGELPHIAIEISVLTSGRPVTSVQEIEVGRHGLIVEQGARRGLLLPQVAVEHGWEPETFLEHTCVKAGLARDAWRRGAQIQLFEAQVFGELEISQL